MIEVRCQENKKKGSFSVPGMVYTMRVPGWIIAATVISAILTTEPDTKIIYVKEVFPEGILGSNKNAEEKEEKIETDVPIRIPTTPFPSESDEPQSEPIERIKW